MSKEIKVNFMRLSGLAFMPKKMTPGAAWYDVKSPRDYVIPPDDQQTIPLDLMVEIEPGHHGNFYSRSGLVHIHKVSAEPGLIDEDYRGNLFVILKNSHKESPFIVKREMRIAQIVFTETVGAQFVEVSSPQVTQRGTEGLGSTGC